jgi:tetratricopeptide (TPR) repeat protein
VTRACLPARLVAVVLALAVVAAPARAQPRKEARKAAEARELYTKAMRHYELGEYDPAIDNFKRAYELSQAPGLLFNLGQVYRLKKDWAQALRLYRSYVRLVPQAKNRADVESMIIEMQANVDEEQRKATEAAAAAQQAQQVPVTPPAQPVSPPSAQEPAPVVVVVPPPPPPPRPKHAKLKMWTGGILAVAGLGAIGAGIALGLRSRSDSRQLIADANDGSQTWDGTHQALYRDGQRMAIGATTLDVVGGALVVVGVVVGVLGTRDWRHTRHFALMPSLHGAGVTCAF